MHDGLDMCGSIAVKLSSRHSALYSPKTKHYPKHLQEYFTNISFFEGRKLGAIE